jgi:hypothetical protein
MRSGRTEYPNPSRKAEFVWRVQPIKRHDRCSSPAGVVAQLLSGASSVHQSSKRLVKGLPSRLSRSRNDMVLDLTIHLKGWIFVIGCSRDLPPRSCMATLGRLRAAIKLANNIAASGTPDESTLAEGVVVQEQYFEKAKAQSESEHHATRREDCLLL